MGSSYAIAQQNKELDLPNTAPNSDSNLTIENTATKEAIDHIAVILPTYNQRIRNITNAIFQGIISKKTMEKDLWFPIHLYELKQRDKSELINTYQNALKAGAKAVIGPLTRKAVNTLYGSEVNFVPTICLNVSQRLDLGITNLYEFGLQMEYEAKAIAQLAHSEGGQQMMTIFENSNLNNRIIQSFNQEWLNLSGKLAEQISIEDNKINFDNIVHMLDTTQADTIFIAVSPDTAQNLRPYLGTRLPIYSTSLVHTSNTNKLRMHDLEEIRFFEMPWIVSHTAKVSQNWGDDSLHLLRFYALGKDAYTLAKKVFQGTPNDLWKTQGETGELTYSDQRFYRKGQPVKFGGGEIKQLETISSE